MQMKKIIDLVRAVRLSANRRSQMVRRSHAEHRQALQPLSLGVRRISWCWRDQQRLAQSRLKSMVFLLKIDATQRNDTKYDVPHSEWDTMINSLDKEHRQQNTQDL